MAHPPDLTLPAVLLSKLRRCYAEPHRHHHTLAHINALQAWFMRCRALAHEPALIDAAIWFHDAAEYAWVGAAAYRSGRVRVLQGFVARERIYRTPVWHDAWESSARRNLRREIAMLSGAV